MYYDFSLDSHEYFVWVWVQNGGLWQNCFVVIEEVLYLGEIGIEVVGQFSSTYIYNMQHKVSAQSYGIQMLQNA